MESSGIKGLSKWPEYFCTYLNTKAMFYEVYRYFKNKNLPHSVFLALWYTNTTWIGEVYIIDYSCSVEKLFLLCTFLMLYIIYAIVSSGSCAMCPEGYPRRACHNL